MSIIGDNPFRILGLMANATEKELQKQIGIIKRYSEIGTPATFDTDYTFLNPISRTLDNVQTAANKIEQGHKKRHFALFWMINNSEFDQMAFDNLKDNEVEKAIDIWNKTLKSSVTEKNFSSYLNLSSLYAALAVKNDEINIEMLQKSFELKLQILNLENLKLFSKLIRVDAKSINSDEIIKQFINETWEWLVPLIDKSRGITIQNFIELFKKYPKNIKTYILNKFIEVPISNIETNIDNTEKMRKVDPDKADEFAQKLFDSTINTLEQVENILGATNIQYQMLANKLANEILQCAIDFYNVFFERVDNEFDAGEETLRLCLIAKSLGITGPLLEKTEQNIEHVQEWIESKPEREANRKIEKELDEIHKQLNQTVVKISSLYKAETLFRECKQPLRTIVETVGKQNKAYLDISDGVVIVVMGMIVNVVNNAQETFNSDNLSSISITFSRAIKLLNELEDLDKSKSVNDTLSTNTTTIYGIDNQIKDAIKKKSEGCYIATMVYGDYEHYQVLALREYRDKTLSQFLLGRVFIKFYYATSPYIVIALRNHPRINRSIKFLLDSIIRRLNNA